MNDLQSSASSKMRGYERFRVWVFCLAFAVVFSLAAGIGSYSLSPDGQFQIGPGVPSHDPSKYRWWLQDGLFTLPLLIEEGVLFGSANLVGVLGADGVHHRSRVFVRPVSRSTCAPAVFCTFAVASTILRCTRVARGRGAYYRHGSIPRHLLLATDNNRHAPNRRACCITAFPAVAILCTWGT